MSRWRASRLLRVNHTPGNNFAIWATESDLYVTWDEQVFSVLTHHEQQLQGNQPAVAQPSFSTWKSDFPSFGSCTVVLEEFSD